MKTGWDVPNRGPIINDRFPFPRRVELSDRERAELELEVRRDSVASLVPAVEVIVTHTRATEHARAPSERHVVDMLFVILELPRGRYVVHDAGGYHVVDILFIILVDMVFIMLEDATLSTCCS
jgi:hypothetical protein